MGFAVEVDDDEVRIRLGGIDRLLCWRREVRVPRSSITAVDVTSRAEVEARLDHRLCGVGSHDGSRGTGRRRVGLFQGRDAGGGRQLWAVGSEDDQVVVVDAEGTDVARVVLPAGVEL